MASLGACGKPPPGENTAPQPQAESGCGASGSLKASLIGEINADLDWAQTDFSCESMQRPDAEGIRLRFSGAVSDERLAIIIAIPSLRSGKTGAEMPSNVTATVEGSGRFFGTPHLESCWTDIRSQERLMTDEDRYRIIGTLYCIAPLGEINGATAVSIPELSFTSIADWSSE